MANYPKAYGNGPLVPLFENVWCVEGLFPMNLGCCVQYIKRTMTVVRSGTELCLVNSLRLDAATEAELSRLGSVKHVAALGFMHGIDDQYFVDTFQARLWGPSGASHPHGLTFTDALEDGKPGPFPELTAFVLQTTKPGAYESCLLFSRGEGPNLLISTDCVQNNSLAPGEEALSPLRQSVVIDRMGPLMGFKGRATTPPMYYKMASPSGTPAAMVDDFVRLHRLDWDALVTAHGTPIKAGAKSLAAAAHAAQFGRSMTSPPR